MCCTSDGCCVDELTNIVPSSPRSAQAALRLEIKMVLAAERKFAFEC